jgi:hypothetical protein
MPMRPGCGWPGGCTGCTWPAALRFTALFCHRRRGKEAIDAAGVLPGFTGTLVHDAFAPYARYRRRRMRCATPTCCAS